MYQIKHNVPDNFNLSKTKGYFMDVRLHDGDEIIQAQSLFLAINFEWFNSKLSELFSQRKDSSQLIYDIDLPLNPDKAFQKLHNAFYSRSLMIEIENSAKLLQVAKFYGASSFIDPIKDFIEKSTNVENVLSIVQSLSLHGSADFAAKICSKFIAQFIHDIVFSNPIRKYNNLDIIFEHLPDATVLAAALKDEIFDEPSEERKTEFLKQQQEKRKMMRRLRHENSLNVITDIQKIHLIDKYVGERHLNDNEREALATTINWDAEDTFSYLVNYNCDWVPARISRKLYQKILSSRRQTAHAMNNIIEENKSKYSGWRIFNWLNEEFYSKAATEDSCVHLFQFISTIGGQSSILDNNLFQFIKFTSTGYPIFDTQNIMVDNNTYYCSMSTKDSLSLIIDTKPTIYMKLESFSVYCDPKKESSYTPALVGQEYKYLQELDLALYHHDQLVSTQTLRFTTNVLKDIKLEKTDISINKFVLSTKPSGIPQALRIRFIDIIGRFVDC